MYNAAKPTTDVVIVLGAKSCATPSVALQRRISQGISVFQETGARWLLLCGGSSDGYPAEADLMAEVARSAGIPEECIVTEAYSRSTWENAELATPVLQKLGCTNGCIVTDSFHLLRARLAFRQARLCNINLVAAARLPLRMTIPRYLREAVAIAWYLLRLTATRH